MRALCLVVWVMLIAMGTSQAATYFVAPDGSDDFPTIAAAISACVDGDVIELGDGTFEGEGNRDLTLADLEITIRSSVIRRMVI